MSTAQPLPLVLGSFLDQSPLCVSLYAYVYLLILYLLYLHQVSIIMSDTLDPADSARVAAVKALLPAIMARRTGISNVSLIVPRLYLSNYTTATDNAELERLGITHMVSVMDFTPANCPAHIKRLHVVLQDTSTANILQHLEQTTEFITAALQENETNKVLVSLTSTIPLKRKPGSSACNVIYQLGPLPHGYIAISNRCVRISYRSPQHDCGRSTGPRQGETHYRLSKPWVPTTTRNL